MKRAADLLLSVIVLFLSLPLTVPTMILIWLQDFHSPFYLAPRVGKDGREFLMVKFRSMVVNADRTGVDSTSRNDPRITAIGAFVRRYKLDELPQFLNVLSGKMSVVGPRPNLRRGTDTYTEAERLLLTVKPGITDFASIVFSDEGDILAGSVNPDRDYDHLIRPWKSRLGIFYVKHCSFLLDLQLTWLTALALFSRKRALAAIAQLLDKLGADDRLIEVSRRSSALVRYPLPGQENDAPSESKAVNS